MGTHNFSKLLIMYCQECAEEFKNKADWEDHQCSEKDQE